MVIRTLRSIWQHGLGLMRDAALEPAATNAMVMFDYLRCGPRWFLIEAKEMIDYPSHEHIHDLHVPLLVVRGAKDPIASEAWGAWLTHCVGDAQLVSIPHYRHNVVHSGAAAVAALVAAFATHQRIASQANF